MRCLKVHSSRSFRLQWWLSNSTSITGGAKPCTCDVCAYRRREDHHEQITSESTNIQYNSREGRKLMVCIFACSYRGDTGRRAVLVLLLHCTFKYALTYLHRRWGFGWCLQYHLVVRNELSELMTRQQPITAYHITGNKST